METERLILTLSSRKSINVNEMLYTERRNIDR